jgi:hypothetical protein
MNIFNRFFMTLLSLALLLIGVIGLLLSVRMIHPRDVSPNGYFLRQWTFLTDLNAADTRTAMLLFIGFCVIGFLLLMMELRVSNQQRATKRP